MNLYIISYDLHCPTVNRAAVEDSIKNLGSWCKYVSTTFLVKSYKSLSEVSDIATSKLDGNDKMIVSKVEKPIYGQLSKDNWSWIHANL